MNIDDLIGDSANTLTTLRSAEAKIYEQYITELSGYEFWSKRTGLWDHQRSAIALALAYISAPRHNPRYPNVSSAALLKLPTGTGKTGITAVLARALGVGRVTLIVTPREALVRQMMEDLFGGIWGKLGYQNASQSIGNALSIEAPEHDSADRTSNSIPPCQVIQLLPVKTKDIVRDALNGNERNVVLVGTFATLQALHSVNASEDAAPLFSLLQDRLDLLIIDEGHYEPAIRWGRAVRALQKPTILLSATPYRNDFKAFNVDARFVYNFPFAMAQNTGTRRHIIRNVEPRNLEVVGPRTPASFAAAVRRFADRHFPDDIGSGRSKVIVRSDNYETLLEIHRHISRYEPCVLVHHRETALGSPNGRYHSYEKARRDNVNARIWIHDRKLLEGVDDPSFKAVILHRNYNNDRDLVQQIGRVLRSTDSTRSEVQIAYFSASSEELADATRRWNRYVAFEGYVSEDVGQFLRKDVALPEVLMEAMPRFQYARYQFRETFNVNTPSAKDLRVPMSASIFTGSPDFDDDQFTQDVQDALYESDRFAIQMIADMPEGALGFSYYAWSGSPLTQDTFFPEWRLGLLVVVRSGCYFFFNDTEGLTFSPKDFGLSRVPVVDMQRLFPADSVTPSRVNRLSFINLDISDTAIRSQVTRTNSFENTFTDLADHTLVPTSASGVVNSKSRYAGFTRARISERGKGPISLSHFVERVRSVALELGGDQTSTRLFSRYAKPLEAPDEAHGRAKSILLDLSDILNEFELMNELSDGASVPTAFESSYSDLCSEVDTHGGFKVLLGASEVECKIIYSATTGRYSIEAPDLSNHFSPKGDTNSDSIVTYLNRNQSFRIVTNEANVVYAHRRFYEVSLTFVDDFGQCPILSGFVGTPVLSNIKNEKGDQFHQEERWSTDSIFGYIYKFGAQRRMRANATDFDPFEREIRNFDVLICDDGPKEFCDFIGVDETNQRIVLIHAKVSHTRSATGITPLQVVGRQALASMALVSRLSRLPQELGTRWEQPLKIDGTVLDRVVKHSGSTVNVTDRVARALSNPSYSREVWIVLGNALDLCELNNQLTRAGGPTARMQQFGYYVDSLRTAFSRANTSLRVYCTDRFVD
jgi:superfamily II DNA or RNA helicase